MNRQEDGQYIILHADMGYTWYICPYCKGTLLISDGTAPVDLPEVCGHCGKDAYFMGNDEEGAEE